MQAQLQQEGVAASVLPAGIFSPDPRRGRISRMIAAQAKIESLLFLRHGEQQLLSLVIPFGLLIILSKFPLIDHAEPVQVAYPLALAISLMSSGFSGQAIAVAFDRRYGALKRIGASGVPAWTIISGKVVAVIVVALIQSLLLSVTALLLGWQPEPLQLLCLGIMMLFGVAAFTSLGLLLGGTLASEIVLALANLLWLLLLGAASWATIHVGLDVPVLANLIPSVALSEGMLHAMNGEIPWLQIVMMVCWFVGAAGLAVKLFKFTS